MENHCRGNVFFYEQEIFPDLHTTLTSIFILKMIFYLEVFCKVCFSSCSNLISNIQYLRLTF